MKKSLTIWYRPSSIVWVLAHAPNYFGFPFVTYHYPSYIVWVVAHAIIILGRTENHTSKVYIVNQVRDGFIKYLLIRIKFHRNKAYSSIIVQSVEKLRKKLHCRVAPQTFEILINPFSYTFTTLVDSFKSEVSQRDAVNVFLTLIKLSRVK